MYVRRYFALGLALLALLWTCAAEAESFASGPKLNSTIAACASLCPLGNKPVCGADDHTYASKCLMGCAGVKFGYKGECIQDKCARVRCNPTVWQPVCGTDRRTYSNRCLSECHAGVVVKHEGRCKDDAAPCVCTKSKVPVCANGKLHHNECVARCHFLTLDPNGCVRECGCPLIKAPVCGTDGVTYPNTCMAECRRIPLKHQGECLSPPPAPATPTPTSTPPAPAPTKKEYKAVAKAASPKDMKLVCDMSCPKTFVPVCGANGLTQDNACKAKCAGQAIKHGGKCKVEKPQALCGCPHKTAHVCSSKGLTFHNKCEALCAGAVIVHKGACKEPCRCPAVHRPVCGADKKIYSNACRAKCANVAVVPCHTVPKPAAAPSLLDKLGEKDDGRSLEEQMY